MSDEIILSTGRVVNAPYGLVSVSADLKRLYEGFGTMLDNRIYNDPWTPEERRELADLMIDRWTRFRDQQLPQSGPIVYGDVTRPVLQHGVIEYVYDGIREFEGIPCAVWRVKDNATAERMLAESPTPRYFFGHPAKEISKAEYYRRLAEAQARPALGPVPPFPPDLTQLHCDVVDVEGRTVPVTFVERQPRPGDEPPT